MGYGVNLSTPFQQNDLTSVLKKWDRRTLYFEGAPGKSLPSFAGQITRPKRGTDHPFHSEIHLSQFEDDPLSLKNFVYELSDEFDAFYAAAHILTKEQLIWRRVAAPVSKGREAWLASRSPELKQKHEESFQRRLAQWPKPTMLGPELRTVSLRRGFIFDLYWLNVFGPPYVEFFERSRVLSIPAYRIEELPYGGIGVQLTQDIKDTENEGVWDRFLAHRTTAKAHLNPNAFFDPALPLGHTYDGPSLMSQSSLTPE